jgi:hypothetical protein
MGHQVPLTIPASGTSRRGQRHVCNGFQRNQAHGEKYQREPGNRPDRVRALLASRQPTQLLGSGRDLTCRQASFQSVANCTPARAIKYGHVGFHHRLLGCEIYLRILAPRHSYHIGRYRWQSRYGSGAGMDAAGNYSAVSGIPVSSLLRQQRGRPSAFALLWRGDADRRNYSRATRTDADLSEFYGRPRRGERRSRVRRHSFPNRLRCWAGARNFCRQLCPETFLTTN